MMTDLTTKPADPFKDPKIFLSQRIFTATPERRREMVTLELLHDTRTSLHNLANQNTNNHRLNMPCLTAGDRANFFRTELFKSWVKSEQQLGHEVVWVTDLDRAMAAGDIFTFFFDWRARNNAFTKEQNEILVSHLTRYSCLSFEDSDSLTTNSPFQNANLVLKYWKQNEFEGKPGISQIDFFLNFYWPTLKGLTSEEKSLMIKSFAPEYTQRIFPGALDENLALAQAGVRVVIVTNDDVDLARGIAGSLGIEAQNTAGPYPIYDDDNKATGEAHFLEIFDNPEWRRRPFNGKAVRFECWSKEVLPNKHVVVAGFDGDSPSPDGGGMLSLQPKLGFFIVDTPGKYDSDRAERFHDFIERYAHHHENSFIIVTYPEPKSGPIP